MNRLPSDHVEGYKTRRNCGFGDRTHRFRGSSFKEFRAVMMVSGRGCHTVASVTSYRTSGSGIIHVTSFLAGRHRCAAIPSPCCNSCDSFRLIVALLRSTYRKLLSGLMRRWRGRSISWLCTASSFSFLREFCSSSCTRWRFRLVVFVRWSRPGRDDSSSSRRAPHEANLRPHHKLPPLGRSSDNRLQIFQ